jgi:myo-inositol catabolism protein IolC
MSHKDELRQIDRTSEELAVEKIAARQKLLSMDPREAQQLVNQTLYPEYWELDPNQEPWEESIETHYGETDA